MNDYTSDEPLLMIPGPVQSNNAVLDSISHRAFSHTEKRFVNAFQGALRNLRPIFDVSEEYSPLVVAGGGTLAMEIAMLNLIDTTKQQHLLVCETGYFGDRFLSLAQALGVRPTSISAEPGSAITEDQLRETLSSEQVDFAFIQHVDTSTGVANDIEMFGRVCQEYQVISVVDGVCALGGQELHQEKWGIDIYLTGAQKALALPPGLAILMYSPRARQISENRVQKIPGYYSNVSNWWPVMDAYLGGGVKYFSTPATNAIVGLHEATKLILEEGMDQVYTRHRRLAQRFRAGLKELGFEFVTEESCLADTLSTPKYLDTSKGAEFRKSLLDQGILVAGGIQQGISQTYFRVGHMGNISDTEIDLTLDAIRTAVQ